MSRTKVALTRDEIEQLSRRAFGASVRVEGITAADNAMFNAGYHLELAGAGPRRTFLKVAPPDDIDVLTYERGMMRAEISVLETIAAATDGTPGAASGNGGAALVPAVLAADLSRACVNRDCLFMAAIDGSALVSIAPRLAPAARIALRTQIGTIAASVNQITAPVFGYPGQPALQGATWTDAFSHMVAALVADAARFDAPLPLAARALEDRFTDAYGLLGHVTSAQLTHFDLWDGNVIVRPATGSEAGDGGAAGAAWTVSGIVDWERAFYGDPVADLVYLQLLRDPDEQTALRAGRARAGVSESDPDAERRLALYRAYLWLIMIVEAGPRGFGGSIALPGSSAARRLMRDLEIANAGGSARP